VLLFTGAAVVPGGRTLLKAKVIISEKFKIG
jgi:hypothetical protein